MLNIGSIGSSDENSNNIQFEINIDLSKHANVTLITDDIFEPKKWHDAAFLPVLLLGTTLLICIVDFLVKGKHSVLGRIFSGFVHSPAKLINPSEIQVRFK